MSLTPPGPPPGPPPPRPADGPPAQPPMGWLRLVLQGSALSSSLITPAVTINGYRVPAQYGENVIPVHSGPNRVEVSCQWLVRYGEATLETTMPEGGQVLVWYAAPMHQFSRGAIGHERQKRPGVVGFVVALVLVLVVVLVITLVAAAL